MTSIEYDLCAIDDKINTQRQVRFDLNENWLCIRIPKENGILKSMFYPQILSFLSPFY